MLGTNSYVCYLRLNWGPEQHIITPSLPLSLAMSSPAAASAAGASASLAPTHARVKMRTRTIRMISYNISMAQPSVQAPSHWMLGVGSGYDHASDLLRAILGHQDDDNDDVPRATSTNNNKTLTEVEVRLRNEILRTQPDIIALQECPARDWSARVICAPTTNNNNDQRRYVSVGTAPSHCGYVDLLVRRDWNWERIDLQRQQQQQEGGLGMTLPSVAAVVNIRSIKTHHRHRHQRLPDWPYRRLIWHRTGKMPTSDSISCNSW